MKYTGVIIEESLSDKSVLKKIKIAKTKTEKVTPHHQTPWVKQWTLHTVEIPEQKAEQIAEKLSWSFDPTHPQWYADFKNETFHYIIFNGMVFRVAIANPSAYQEVKNYGVGIGIPDHQLDFAPKDMIWERKKK